MYLVEVVPEMHCHCVLIDLGTGSGGNEISEFTKVVTLSNSCVATFQRDLFDVQMHLNVLPMVLPNLRH